MPNDALLEMSIDSLNLKCELPLDEASEKNDFLHFALCSWVLDAQKPRPENRFGLSE